MPLIVHWHGHLPLCPHGLAHGPKTCQISHKLSPDFPDRTSLKTAGSMYPIQGFMDLSRPVVVHYHSY